MSRVVVGVDGSAESIEALRFAIAEARLRGSTVRAVHALEVPTVYWPGLVALVGVALEEGNRVLNRAIADAFGHEEPDVPLERSIVEASAGSALVRESEEADLLVVGSRGRGGFAGLLLGSVSQHCVQHAACPVAIARGATRAPRGRVVVGLDGSEASRAALRWAAEEAAARGSGLTVVHAWTPQIEAGPFVVLAPPATDRPADLKAFVDAELRAVLGQEAAADADVRVAVGPPAPVLLAAASDADLLVVGSRGRGGFSGLVLGSVGHRCAVHAPCPVVVARGFPRTRALASAARLAASA